jgi:hypothetical protein
MIQRVMWPVIVLLGILQCSACTQAEPILQAKSAIQANYNRSNSAASKLHVYSTFISYAPEFTLIDLQGHVRTLAESESAFRSMCGYILSQQASTKIQNITIKDAAATVLVKEHRRAVILNSMRGSSDVQTMDSVYRDVWIKTNAGWLLTYRKTLSQVIQTKVIRPQTRFAWRVKHLIESRL